METTESHSGCAAPEVSQAAAAPEEAADGQPLSAEEIYSRYLEVVFRYVSRRVPRYEEAEDVTAEVFAAVFSAPHHPSGDRRLYLWLLGVARRKIADSLRGRQRRRETLASELVNLPQEGASGLDTYAAKPDSPEAQVVRAERRSMVRDLVSQLKAEQREALLLKYVDGLSVAEITVVMGRRPAAVNSLLQRARATLFRRGHRYFLSDEEGSAGG